MSFAAASSPSSPSSGQWMLPHVAVSSNGVSRSEADIKVKAHMRVDAEGNTTLHKVIHSEGVVSGTLFSQEYLLSLSDTQLRENLEVRNKLGLTPFHLLFKRTPCIVMVEIVKKFLRVMSHSFATINDELLSTGLPLFTSKPLNQLIHSYVGNSCDEFVNHVHQPQDPKSPLVPSIFETAITKHFLKEHYPHFDTLQRIVWEQSRNHQKDYMPIVIGEIMSAGGNLDLLATARQYSGEGDTLATTIDIM